MMIRNVNDLIYHMGKIGVRFRDVLRAECMVKFDRFSDGEKAAKYVETWVHFPDSYMVELGADYDGNPETWFSETFIYPFDSSEFDSYLFNIETHRS